MERAYTLWGGEGAQAEVLFAWKGAANCGVWQDGRVFEPRNAGDGRDFVPTAAFLGSGEAAQAVALRKNGVLAANAYQDAEFVALGAQTARSAYFMLARVSSMMRRTWAALAAISSAEPLVSRLPMP